MLRMRAELLAARPDEATGLPSPTMDSERLFDAALPAHELGIRYLSMSDRFWSNRAAWVEAIFPAAEAFPLIEIERVISPARGTAFDVLIIGGNDSLRIANTLRVYDVMLSKVVKIALGTDLGPMRRAQSLAAGFDDVFDTAKMPPAEAVARLRSIHSRYALNAARLREKREEATARGRARVDYASVLRFVEVGARLTRQERNVMLMLVSRRGETVRYEALQNAMRLYHEPPTFDHLKVCVCNLRKKLLPQAKVVATMGLGYRLECPAAAVLAAA